MSNQLAVVENGAYAVGEKAYLTVGGVHRKVEKMYLTRKRKPKKLYEVLEYIKSTGTQYVKTSYIPKANSSAEMVANISAVNVYPTPFGVRRSSGSEAFLVFPRHNSANKLMADFGSGEFEVGSTNNLLGKKITITLRPNYVSAEYDSSNKIEKTFTSGTPISTQPVYLFTLNENGKDYGDVCHATMEFCSFSVDEGEKEAVRIVAVRRLTDGELGVYDRMTKEFHPNAGTGEFIAGPATGEFIYDVEEEAIHHRLVYKDELMLYDFGDECEDVTGGWISVANQTGINYPKGTATKNADNLYLYSANAGTGWTFPNTIDVTGYKTLKAVVTASGLYNRINLYTGAAYADISVAYVDNSFGVVKEVSLDISEISGEYHVHLGCFVWGSNCDMTIYRVWLE